MRDLLRFIRLCLTLLAVGMFLAAMYYAIQGIAGSDIAKLLPAILYTIGGLVLLGIQKLFELVE